MSSTAQSIASQLQGTVLSSGLNALGSILNVIPQGSIADIEIQATFEESYTDTLQVTSHPVQTGANITDHSYVMMPEYVIRCGWSNSGQGVQSAISSTISSVTNAVQSAQAGFGLVTGAQNSSASASFAGGAILTGDYVGSIYAKLLNLQQQGQVFDVMTSIRLYQNMLMTSLRLTRDQTTSQALMVTATCRQVLIVSTASASLPPISAQYDPMTTAENVSTGTQSVIPGSPAPTGGAVPSASWDGFGPS